MLLLPSHFGDERGAETIAVVHGGLRHPKNMKVRLDSDVPPGLTQVVCRSQGSAALHPGLFSYVPSGNLRPESAIDHPNFQGRSFDFAALRMTAHLQSVKFHQMRHGFALTILSLGLQLKLFANSGKSCRMELVRYSSGACGLACAWLRSCSGRVCVHHCCA